MHSVTRMWRPGAEHFILLEACRAWKAHKCEETYLYMPPDGPASLVCVQLMQWNHATDRSLGN